MDWTKGQRERDRLLKLYGEMSDGELLRMHETANDLTEAAQEALSGEMNRRGLEPLAEEMLPQPTAQAPGWKTLHVFQQTFEAQAAFRLLERDEIEFAVEDRTLDENGELVPGPAVQLALMVDAADWDRSVLLLRREAGLFPEAVIDPRGDEQIPGDSDLVAVGEFEEPGDVLAATQAMEEAGIWHQTVSHEGEVWERTSMEVKAEDQDRALEVLAKLLEEEGA